MKTTRILIVLFGVVLCALAAGCTSPTSILMKSGTPTPSPQVTVSPETTLLSQGAFMPVQTLPAEQYVDVQLTKERPDYTIHLLYNGGKGEVSVQNIFLKATLSDGQVIEKYLNDNQRQPRRGDEIIIKGTRGSDRVEVYITSVGQTYKILDKELLVNRL
ncbi:hypothetical protein [Methanoregula formicica]|uniref:Lipoprotein n=1 Tax=Methanoregula formicica (strain DSM 22288 / NBRC 105244 / SMSP) TaxID=593750 RepID=L0HDN2_METFS|nr:hypothetical protein [Methanoregula formicica]AGB01438.1 hypothetical protein Metfor_0364 [Methanoregula formicica SMSP]